MAPAIPINNLYYLLCYAWNRLEQGALIDVSQIPTTELVDLFALVLCDGVRHLARRGLEQGYDLREEELNGIRGRLDIASSVRRFLFMQGRAFCTYDELSADTKANRILKATLKVLLKSEDLDRDLGKKVYATWRTLQGIRDIRLSREVFSSVRVTSSSLFYRFLINVCSLIFDSLLVDEHAGTCRFRDFTRDEDKMAKLFQSFLFSFISRECPQWTVKSENINWQAASEVDPNLDLLPRMQTDISIARAGEYRIIDAKYYRQTLGTYFGSQKVHSENLYQMMSYLMNANKRGDTFADGMLIYPKVDRELRENYEILGKRVAICTIDLGAPWQSIDQEIRTLMR